MSATEIQQLAQLSPYALMIVVIGVLWKAYREEHKAHIDDLKQSYEKGISDLRNRTMMIEDKLSIKRPLADDEPPIPLKMP